MKKNKMIGVFILLMPLTQTQCTTRQEKQRQIIQSEKTSGEYQQGPNQVSVNYKKSRRDYCSKMQLKLEQNKLLIAQISEKNSASASNNKLQEADVLAALLQQNKALELRLKRFQDNSRYNHWPAFRTSFTQDMDRLQNSIRAAGDRNL